MQQRGKKGNTDDLLAASFKELLCKAPMEKITIKDITDKAGVIRPTFYNHFADKYALLEYIDLLEPIKPLLLNDMIQEGLTLLFSSMQNERAFYERAVCIDGQNSFESIARSEVSKLLLEIIDQKKQGKSHKYTWLDRQIIAEYYANSMCYVAIAWIKRDYMISPKDLSEVYKYLTKSSMMDVLNELV
mgnify:FL=1